MLGTAGAASLAPVLLHAGSPAGNAEKASADPELRPAFTGVLRIAGVGHRAAGGRSAAITDGQVEGNRLAGQVQGGHIDWLPRDDGGHELSVHFEVHADDGRMVEVAQRAILPAGIDPASRVAVTATIEPLAIQGGASDVAVLAGRLDATGLERGLVQLLAFEVA